MTARGGRRPYLIHLRRVLSESHHPPGMTTTPCRPANLRNETYPARAANRHPEGRLLGERGPRHRRPHVPTDRRLRPGRRPPVSGAGEPERFHRLAVPAAIRLRGLLRRAAG